MLTKITVKVFGPQLKDFDKQLAQLHMKRDAFFESMLLTEIPVLADELSGRRLSARARRYIAGELKRMGTIPVNIQVQQSTADALNDVVAQGNIVRDAFINRLILFLRGSEVLLRFLDLPRAITYSDYKAWVEPMPTSPLQALKAVQDDPLYYIRTAIQERHETGLYLVDLPQKYAGFSCYLSEDRVPGTAEFAEAQRLADEILADLLDTSESEAFSKTVPGEKQ